MKVLRMWSVVLLSSLLLSACGGEDAVTTLSQENIQSSESVTDEGAIQESENTEEVKTDVSSTTETVLTPEELLLQRVERLLQEKDVTLQQAEEVSLGCLGDGIFALAEEDGTKTILYYVNAYETWVLLRKPEAFTGQSSGNGVKIGEVKATRDCLEILYEWTGETGEIQTESVVYDVCKELLLPALEGRNSFVHLEAENGVEAVWMIAGSAAGSSAVECYISTDGGVHYESTWSEETVKKVGNQTPAGLPSAFYPLEQGGYLMVLPPGTGGFPCGEIMYCPGTHQDWTTLSLGERSEYEELTIQEITHEVSSDGTTVTYTLYILHTMPDGAVWESVYELVVS